jgi:dinuclear metal center YbgI/SA1388 family protein
VYCPSFDRVDSLLFNDNACVASRFAAKSAMATELTRLVEYTEKHLSHQGFQDYPGALNGLQLENNGHLTRIAAAVDANLLTIGEAVAVKADLLVVHHGIGWSPLCPVTGVRYQWFNLAVENNLAIYSSHLPLDAHPVLGNNILLAKALGLKKTSPFFFEKGIHLGYQAKGSWQREELLARVGKATGAKSLLLPFGPITVKRVGIVTGGAGNSLAKAAGEGVDTFITGEGNHWTFSTAQELEINVIYGGHYATETFGVKALAAHLSKKFKLPWSFIDAPSGL